MHPDLLGWTAAALTVATFSLREVRPLRPLAVVTDLAFAGYGAAAGLMPVLALHLLLLPINLWRWMQAASLSPALVQQGIDRAARVLATLALAALPLITGCSGGGDEGAQAASPSPLGTAGSTVRVGAGANLLSFGRFQIAGGFAAALA